MAGENEVLLCGENSGGGADLACGRYELRQHGARATWLAVGGVRRTVLRLVGLRGLAFGLDAAPRSSPRPAAPEDAEQGGQLGC